MFFVPIGLLVALLVIVFSANSMKKKGALTESAYQSLISIASLIVTIVALAAMWVRIRHG